jgi:RimJ/RimL family protein N-acetyltransferase
MRLQYKFKFIKNNHKFLISKIEKNDISQKYIKSINQSKFLRYNIKSLINKKLQIEYIDKINNSEDNIIIGIFNKGKLIGTCGAQKKTKKKYYLGIFIFDENFKGLQLSKIMISFMSNYLKQNNKVTFVYASVNKKNLISHNLFKSLKFIENFNEKKRYKSDVVYFIQSKHLNFF